MNPRPMPSIGSPITLDCAQLNNSPGYSGRTLLHPVQELIAYQGFESNRSKIVRT